MKRYVYVIHERYWDWNVEEFIGVYTTLGKVIENIKKVYGKPQTARLEEGNLYALEYTPDDDYWFIITITKAELNPDLDSFDFLGRDKVVSFLDDTTTLDNAFQE